MKVIVTGGAGFIGANFVFHLIKNRPDWDVTVIDKLTYSGNFSTIEPVVKSGKVKFVKCDIADFAEMDSQFAALKPEQVIHFAAESHVDRSIHGAEEFVRTNVLGTQSLLDASRNHGVQRFTHVSTDEVYGSLGETGRFYETTPLDPTSPYSASKAASDLMALAACKTHKLDVVVTRCTNNYGPYQFPEKFIPLFTTHAFEDKSLPLYGDGRNVRSWLHVDDHCSGVLKVAEGGKTGEVYNIGADEDSELSNLVVAKRILNILGKPESLIQRVEDRLAHDLRYAVDTAKIKTELGWSPNYNFEDGLKATVDWYIENKDWWQSIKSGEYQKFYDLNYGEK